MVPRLLQEQHDRLVKMIERDNKPFLNTKEVAEDVFGMDYEAFRMLIATGQIPFGIGGRENIAANRITKVSKLALWNWFFPGTVLGKGQNETIGGHQ